jgi:ribulose-bisphosphate carboxylase large chain
MTKTTKKNSRRAGRRRPARAGAPAGATAGFRLHRHRGGCSWSGIRKEQYKACDDTWSDVIRRNLVVGLKGEKTAFHLRYFEIAPGGRTTLERHRHEHVVVGLKGKGRCQVGRRKMDLGFLDTLYIEPHVPHQLSNPFDEPFGFFCMVDARRDRPRPLREAGQ